MSFEHKAFIFDIDSFSHELKPLLEAALRSEAIEPIRKFIVHNKQLLVDPYEGESLDENWESMIECADVHQYGDFALTKYYSPLNDRGVGFEWGRLQEQISRNGRLDFLPFLGTPVGVDGCFFDPGKMGSYFQGENNLVKSLCELRAFESELRGELFGNLVRYRCLLEQAVSERKGVYITF